MVQQVNKFFIIPDINFKHPLLFLTLYQSHFVRVTLLKSAMFLREITHRRYVCHVCISALFASSLYSPTPRGDYRRGETFIKASTSWDACLSVRAKLSCRGSSFGWHIDEYGARYNEKSRCRAFSEFCFYSFWHEYLVLKNFIRQSFNLFMDRSINFLRNFCRKPYPRL